MRPGEETSVEEWEERFRKDVKRRPGWSVLPIEILFSQAYRSLTGSAQLALQFALSQVSWEKTRRPGKRKKLRNDTIYLPTNALAALGIRSSATRTALRKDLVEKGFLDVKKTGSYLNCGVFKASGRWRYYPNGDYKPQDQPLPGIAMGHRFKSENGDEDAPEETFLRSEIKRKGDSIFERKGIPEKPIEDSSLRLKNERKPVRLENERTVLSTNAEQSDEKEKVQVQYPEEEETKNPSSEMDSHTPIQDIPSIVEDLPSEPIQKELQHQWFLDTFREACSEKGIDANIPLSPALATALDDWLSQKLSKKSYIGNKCFFDQKPNHIKDKIHEIVSAWESLRTSGLGRRIGVPPLPDLEFLVANREAIFSWVSQQRQRSLDRILTQLDSNELKTSASHMHSTVRNN
jgi:hypothetical protein